MSHTWKLSRRRLAGITAVIVALVVLGSGLLLGAEFSADQPLAPAIVAGSLGLIAVMIGRWGLRNMLPPGLRH